MPAATSELRAQVYIPPGVNIDFDDGVLTNNLLEDGGFGASGVGWSTLPASGGSMNFATYSNSGAHDGRSYAEANSSLDGGSIYQDVAVNMAQNQSATLSMWVRLAPGTAVAGQSADLCVWALVGSNTSACESKALTEEWQQLQATVTMPAATSKLRAQVYIPANINVDFDGATLGAPQTADAAYVPAVLTNPEVVGTVAVGSSVACSGAQWSNEPESYAYAWMRDGKPIASATAAAYSVTSADAGQSLSCAITARNAAGSAIGTSGAVSVSPQIAGTPGPSGSGTDLSGTSPGQEQATAPGCVVPRLRNMTLAQAKTALTRSHCRLGSVRRPVHVARRHVLRVWAQSVRRGSRHPSGYAVNLTLRAVKT
jgi:hypothetical protein